LNLGLQKRVSNFVFTAALFAVIRAVPLLDALTGRYVLVWRT
jgi:hypothetical protein